MKFSDGVTLPYNRAETGKMLDLFEHWYSIVSRGGRFCTRSKARAQIVNAYKKKCVKDKVMASRATASAAASATVSEEVDLTVDSDDEEGQIRAAIGLRKMKKKECFDVCKKLGVDTHGSVKELRTRIAKVRHIDLAAPDSEKKVRIEAKHKATWAPRRVTVERAPFTRERFNMESLTAHLPGFPDRCPTPAECWQFFFTKEMVQLGVQCTNLYPRYISSCMVRPPWVREDHSWPPKWTASAVKFTEETFVTQLMVLYMLGLKHKRRCTLRSMFGTDEYFAERWLKRMTSRNLFEAFLRQLHFEDNSDPRGNKFEGSTDYRPNGVPKVGLLLEFFRRRCMLFLPESDMSYDEATAKYGGKMTKLKHVQSRYKPYDGIRIYSLNGSKTGYTSNFRVDLRDGASNEDIMASIIRPLRGHGYTVWGDNAFVSVAMLRQCKEWKINFAGTTRTTFGFPRVLIDESLKPGSWRWLMTSDGLLAAYWSDVGFVKLMSNFHEPDGGFVFRRISGQADKAQRDAPEVGVHYNYFMGGTDLVDWMRGVYTTARMGKKWWKSLNFWVDDASMINAFILHRWCSKKIHPHKKYKLKLGTYIRKVCMEMAPSCDVYSPQRRRRYVVPRRTPVVESEGYRGPNGEDQQAHANENCPGGELVRQPKVTTGKRAGRLYQSHCRYCFNKSSLKKPRRWTTYMCSVCRTPLCPTCTYRYHLWIND